MIRKVSLKELASMAANARESIWAQARSVGREPKIYLHWTAGRYCKDGGRANYNQLFLDEYHIAIDKDGSIYADNDLDEVLAHTWRRNTGSVGITLACAFGANTSTLGTCPPTEKQIESMAMAISVIAKGLWLTIDKKRVMTHGEAADNEDGLWIHDSYGPKTTVERWDLEYLGTNESPRYRPWSKDGNRGGDVLRGKANWYSNTYPDGVQNHF